MDVDNPDEKSILLYVSYLSDKLGDFVKKVQLAKAQAAVQVPGKRSVRDVTLAAQVSKRRESAHPAIETQKSDLRRSTSPQPNLGLSTPRLSASTNNLRTTRDMLTIKKASSSTGHLALLTNPSKSLSSKNTMVVKKPRMSASSDNLSAGSASKVSEAVRRRRLSVPANENMKSRRKSVPSVNRGKGSSVNYNKKLSTSGVTMGKMEMNSDSEESGMEESQVSFAFY